MAPDNGRIRQGRAGSRSPLRRRPIRRRAPRNERVPLPAPQVGESSRPLEVLQIRSRSGPPHPAARGSVSALIGAGNALPNHGQVSDCFSVRKPVDSEISKRSYRLISQSVCPWNVKFSQELAAGSPFAARQFIAGKDAVTLTTDILALNQDSFSAAFNNSPMKRAKLAGLQRNAAVVLKNSREGA